MNFWTSFLAISSKTLASTRLEHKKNNNENKEDNESTFHLNFLNYGMYKKLIFNNSLATWRRLIELLTSPLYIGEPAEQEL
jgi:hypothetical protein